MKHTKGPWKNEEVSSSGYTWYDIRVNGLLIGSVEKNGQDISIDEAKQNAKLISKAPELLEALKKVVLIINESEGVLGYHLNGNIAEWDEFEEIQEIKSLLKELE